MEFRFDELTVNKKFFDRLEEYMLGARLVRPAMLGNKFGMTVIVLDKLVGQKNGDVINILVRQMTEAMAMGIAKLQAANSRALFVHPMEFEYTRGEFDDGNGGLAPGTEVKIMTKVEEVE